MDVEMNQETLEKLRLLHLNGMYNAFKASLENFNRENLTIDKFVNMLVTNEWDERYNASVLRLIKGAGFKFPASLENIDYSQNRGIDQNMMERIGDLSFLKENKDIFITGSCGTGKTYVATAIGYAACQKGYKVLYYTTSRLLGLLKASKATGNILRDLKRVQRADILILDDFALSAFDTITRGLLMDIIEDRYDTKSTIIASQIPVSEWYDAIGDATLADAILDRIVHKAVRIELEGESMRKKLK